eukprot:6181449-Pleurochrysis_carterae.AAC.2
MLSRSSPRCRICAQRGAQTTKSHEWQTWNRTMHDCTKALCTTSKTDDAGSLTCAMRQLRIARSCFSPQPTAL